MSGFVRITACCLILGAGCRSADKLTSWSHQDEVKNAAATDKLTEQIEKSSPGLSSKVAQNQPKKSVEDHVQAGQAEVHQWYQDRNPERLATARTSFAAALLLAPQSSGAHHGLAIVADLEQNYAEAERHYQQALIQKPNDSTILGDMGYSYLLQNRLSESEQYSLRAIQADQKNENALKHLADAYARQGKTQLAQETYAKLYSPEDVQKQLAENAPQKPAEHVTKSSGSIFERLNPIKSGGDKLLADVQQRRQDYELQQQQRSSNGLARPSASQPNYQERLAHDSMLRDQLRAIENEGVPPQMGGTLLLDDQTGQITRLPGAEGHQNWNGAGMPAAQHSPMANQGMHAGQMEHFGQAPALAQQNHPAYLADRQGQYVANGENFPQQLPADRQSPSYADQPLMSHQENVGSRNQFQPQFPERSVNSNRQAWGGIQQASGSMRDQANAPVQQAYRQADEGQPNQVMIANGQNFGGQNTGINSYPGQPQQSFAGNGTNPAQNAGAPTGSFQGMNPLNSYPGNPQNSPQIPGQGSLQGQYAQNVQPNAGVPGQAAGANAYYEASKAAARMGMGIGPGSVFPVVNQAQAINPPGSLSYDNSGAQPPLRWMPDEVPPQNLNDAYQPYPNTPRPPVNSDHAPAPGGMYPSYGKEQFGTASRYDTQTLRNSNIPQDYNASMQEYETQRWIAGREANIAVQEIWNQGPVNSPVSPSAGSIYTMPNAQGMMFTPNAPSLTGPGQTDNPWPNQPFAPQGNPQQQDQGQYSPNNQNQQLQDYSQQNAPQNQLPPYSNGQYRTNFENSFPGVPQNSVPPYARPQNLNQNNFNGNRDNIIIPSEYRTYNNSSVQSRNPSASPATNSQPDASGWPTIVPASR